MAWNILVSIGDIALASAYTQIAVDIQDSLKSSPPENKVMKRANMIGILTMTIFFMLNACAGYAAFGSNTPGNILMSSGFHKPFWLLELANVFIIVHLLGAFQVSQFNHFFDRLLYLFFILIHVIMVTDPN